MLSKCQWGHTSLRFGLRVLDYFQVYGTASNFLSVFPSFSNFHTVSQLQNWLHRWRSLHSAFCHRNIPPPLGKCMAFSHFQITLKKKRLPPKSEFWFILLIWEPAESETFQPSTNLLSPKLAKFRWRLESEMWPLGLSSAFHNQSL